MNSSFEIIKFGEQKEKKRMKQGEKSLKRFLRHYQMFPLSTLWKSQKEKGKREQ